MEQQSLAEKKDRLKTMAEEFVRRHERLHRVNFYVNAALILLGILFALGAIVFGLSNDASFAALMGALTGALITYDKAFQHGEKADFYRIIVAEGKNLLDTLEFKVDTERKLENALEMFQTLRKYTAEKLPRGQGMETVRNMSRELRAMGFES